MTGTRRKDKAKPGRRKPGVALYIRGAMSFLQGNNIDSNRKGSQPLQETLAPKGFTKAIDIKGDYGQSHNEIDWGLEQT